MYEQSQDSNYSVEEILMDRIIQGKLYYLVKWKGYPQSQNSWQPQQHLQNALQHLQIWKQRKNKLRKLDKVSKRKKDEESFDGDKYLKNKDIQQSNFNQQIHQNKRKSQRIKEKDYKLLGRHQQDLSGQKTSQTQQGEAKQTIKAKTLFQVLTSIQKINKQNKQKLTSQNKESSSLNIQQPEPIVTKKKKGRPKKNQIKNIINKEPTQIHRKLRSNKQQGLQKSIHKNDQINKQIPKDNKLSTDQQSEEMNKKNKDTKPQIYDEILQYPNDNMQRSKYFNKVRNKQNHNNKNKISRNNNNNSSQFNNQQHQKCLHNKNNNLRKNSKSPQMIDSLGLFNLNLSFQEKESKKIDNLQQIGLSDSKRIPNFLDRFRVSAISSHIPLQQRKSNNGSVELPNQYQSTDQIKNDNTKANKNHWQFSEQQALDGRRPYKSNISSNCQEGKNVQIEIQSSQNNFNEDSSVLIIEQEDYAKSVKNSEPRKKIFLNEEYDKVSVNVGSNLNKIQKQNYLSKQTEKGLFQQKIVTPCDPRIIHMAKAVSQKLYEYLFERPSLKRFELSPQQYVKGLLKKTKKQIKSRGLCVDFPELQKRQVVTNWQVKYQGEQQEEVVSVCSFAQDSEQRLTNDSKILSNEQSSKNSEHMDSSNLSSSQSVAIIQERSFINHTHKDHTMSKEGTNSSNQQSSEDKEVLEGIQYEIEDIFKERYPNESITPQIKQQIKKIVKKIAYENMEIQVGLNLIYDWVDNCQKINKAHCTQSASPEQKNNMSYFEVNKQFLKKSKKKNMEILDLSERITASKESEEGEILFSNDSLRHQQQNNLQNTPKKTEEKQPQIQKSTPLVSSNNLPHPQSGSSNIPKPTQIIEEANILKIVEQFEYRSERCFKLLLKNNKLVNVHYLELKKNCPKVLFDYLEVKCQQFQKQYLNKGKLVS